LKRTTPSLITSSNPMQLLIRLQSNQSIDFVCSERGCFAAYRALRRITLPLSTPSMLPNRRSSRPSLRRRQRPRRCCRRRRAHRLRAILSSSSSSISNNRRKRHCHRLPQLPIQQLVSIVCFREFIIQHTHPDQSLQAPIALLFRCVVVSLFFFFCCELCFALRFSCHLLRYEQLRKRYFALLFSHANASFFFFFFFFFLLRFALLFFLHSRILR
jgi:hypothetical protein